MKVLIACSSSGGHINPAISFGKFLKMKGIEVTYLGFKNQLEETFIKDKLILIEGENSFNKNIKKFGFFKLFKEINKIKKNNDYSCYFGFGGFINILLIFLKKNKPLFIHEQNVSLGDSNKIVKLFSKKVFYSFPKEGKEELVVGNPSLENIVRKNFTYKRNLNILFVFGSLGSKSLLKKLKEFDGKLNPNHTYTLIGGLSNKNKTDYQFKQIKVISYLPTKQMVEDYDLVICRGGATTLYELLNGRVNTISIPSPYVKHNHQEKNVDYLYEKNLISRIYEKDLTLERLNREINNFIDYDFSLSRFRKLEKFEKKDSSLLMYQEMIKYVKD